MLTQLSLERVEFGKRIDNARRQFAAEIEHLAKAECTRQRRTRRGKPCDSLRYRVSAGLSRMMIVPLHDEHLVQNGRR